MGGPRLGAVAPPAPEHTEPDVSDVPDDVVSDDDDVVSDAGPTPSSRAPRARKRRGLSGALLAGALTGLRDALEDRPDQTEPAVVEVPGTPHDIDSDGVEVDSHDQTFAAPPLAPLPSEVRPEHRRRAKR